MVVSGYPSVLALESPSLTGSEQRPTLTEVFVFTRSTRSAINVDALSYGAEMCTRLTVQFKVVSTRSEKPIILCAPPGI